MNFEKLGKIVYLEEMFNTTDRCACKYVVETYDECIENQDFEDFVEKSVKIIPFTDLKTHYNDILMAVKDIQNVCELFAILDFGEFWVGKECIYSTLANKEKIDNRTKFDYISICMEYERLATLIEYEIANQHDAESTLTCLKIYGLDIECDNIYGKDDAETCTNIINRLNQILGLH